MTCDQCTTDRAGRPVILCDRCRIARLERIVLELSDAAILMVKADGYIEFNRRRDRFAAAQQELWAAVRQATVTGDELKTAGDTSTS